MSMSTENLFRSEAELKIDLARKQKAEKYKDIGDPISLPGVPLDIKVRGNYVWVAESTHITRKIDLQTGKTVQLYKGHSGPVTSLAFCGDKKYGSGDENILITGSWDKTIKIWNTDTRAVISSTSAHTDFVKALLVVPSLELLISGSSDKSVRFWDLSSPHSPSELPPVGSISAHSRPVESLAAYLDTTGTRTRLVLFTADTMGAIKVWDVVKDSTEKSPIWRCTLRDELERHRTKINEIVYGNGHLWSASADETIQLHLYPPPTDPKLKPSPPIVHRAAFRTVLPIYLHPKLDPETFSYLLAGSGDSIIVYDVSSLDEAELVREVQGHWHDVTHLQIWLQEPTRDVWVVSGSLDGSLRKWKLSELVVPPSLIKEESKRTTAKTDESRRPLDLTEEEEKELAELMEDEV
ncbi:WD40-repeat-containing domain protein [Multifurca ochricompacta]|uniref:WD40-repeat-containing domain protein n=1 Tax=Multifurca ochricompacta TaxID=376703 RepID=A0AAD4MAE5_9AGAM|nr:WD40-repeat-containing domain protein [Multifurca ochricompacta]